MVGHVKGLILLRCSNFLLGTIARTISAKNPLARRGERSTNQIRDKRVREIQLQIIPDKCRRPDP